MHGLVEGLTEQLHLSEAELFELAGESARRELIVALLPVSQATRVLVGVRCRAQRVSERHFTRGPGRRAHSPPPMNGCSLTWVNMSSCLPIDVRSCLSL